MEDTKETKPFKHNRMDKHMSMLHVVSRIKSAIRIIAEEKYLFNQKIGLKKEVTGKMCLEGKKEVIAWMLHKNQILLSEFIIEQLHQTQILHKEQIKAS